MNGILTEKEINSEAKIVKEAQQDPKAFSPLYNKYYPAIFRFIFSRTNNEESTADLTSQVFLKALVHLHKWRNEGVPFSAWLYRIALNECREYFRATKKVQYVILDDAAKSRIQEETNLFLENENKLNEIEAAIQNLKRKEIQLVELRFYEKLSFKEIGYLTGITENNAKVKLYRVINKIRKEIKR